MTQAWPPNEWPGMEGILKSIHGAKSEEAAAIQSSDRRTRFVDSNTFS